MGLKKYGENLSDVEINGISGCILRGLIAMYISPRSLETHFNVEANFRVLVNCHLKFQETFNAIEIIES